MDVSWTLKKPECQELIFLNCGVGEDSWEFLGQQEIQPVHPKENQSRIFIGRTDAEAESAILWPPDCKNCLVRKVLDAGKDWRLEEKGMTEDEMVGWHHWLKGYKFEQVELVIDRNPGMLQAMGYKESEMTEWLNWTERITSAKKVYNKNLEIVIKCCKISFWCVCIHYWLCWL